MSRFLRNAIVAARNPGASLQPRVPSLYADLAEQPMADGIASAHARFDEFYTRPSSRASRDAERSEYGHDALDENIRAAPEQHGGPTTIDAAGTRSPAALLSRVTGQATGMLHGSFEHAPADTAPASATTMPAAEVLRPLLARPVREDHAPGRVEPSLREPVHVAEARSQRVASRPPQRTAGVEARGARAAAGRSPPPSNDVEIHIGRIEVIAAAPAVRAPPPKSTHKSPSLADYLNGRRGRRP